MTYIDDMLYMKQKYDYDITINPGWDSNDPYRTLISPTKNDYCSQMNCFITRDRCMYTNLGTHNVPNPSQTVYAQLPLKLPFDGEACRCGTCHL
jgi:hypothetical protein